MTENSRFKKKVRELMAAEGIKYTEARRRILTSATSSSPGDLPHTNPGDGRPQCSVCGKFQWPAIHSCKGVRVAAPDPTSPPWPGSVKDHM